MKKEPLINMPEAILLIALTISAVGCFNALSGDIALINERKKDCSDMGFVWISSDKVCVVAKEHVYVTPVAKRK